MGGEGGELLGREGHDGTSSFEVTGEEVSTQVDVGFGGGSSVGPRGDIEGGRETRRCHGWGSGTRGLSEGKETGVGGDRVPSDLVFVECRGRKIGGAERATPRRPRAPFI